MVHLRWRRWVLAAVLIVFGGGCSFAHRLPAVILGTQPVVVMEGTALPENGETPQPAAAAETAAPVPTSKVTASPQAVMVLAAIKIEETSEAPSFDIRGRYPALEWDADPRADTFNRAAERIVQREIRAFKEGVYKIPQESPFSELSSFLEFDFSPTASEHGILAIKYEISFYMAGAAHPGHYAYALNYDLQNGRVIELDELFAEDAQYLEMLSETCLEDLRERGRLEWEEGALPEEENYQVWNITPDGLLITFDEYQVASYAAGAQTVMIPYTTLEPVLNPDGPLREFLSSEAQP